MQSEPSREAIEAAMIARADAGCINPDCKGCIKDMLTDAYSIDFADIRAELQSAREENLRLHKTIGEYERDQMLMEEIAAERDRLQAEIERLKRDHINQMTELRFFERRLKGENEDLESCQ